MRLLQRWLGICSFLFVLLPSATSASAADDWLPIPPEDLAMKQFTPIPGTHAVILYKKDEQDDKDGWEKLYYRIKILDEEGKKYANIETNPYPSFMKVANFEARTIRPDGNIVPFAGQPNEKLVAKYKDFQLNQKTLALPEVQTGSVIEYQYTLKWPSGLLYDSEWRIQEYLPVRDAEFRLRYNSSAGYNFSWLVYMLTQANMPKEEQKGVVALTLHMIPPLEKEEYLPPDAEIRARVEFMYHGDLPKSVDDFWKDQAKWWSKGAEDFLNKRKAAEKVVAETTAAGDSPEVKLQKLYERVQKLRNLTYEHSKSEKEQQREKLKDNETIEDVLKHGYGYHNELVRTYVALARAAGMEATIIRVVERDQHFHHKEIPNFRRYDTELALVKMNDKELFLDPGTLFCPFGLLAWEDTATFGLVLNKDGAVWEKTPDPLPEDTLQQRTAQLELSREGDLRGDVTLRFEGRDALYERLREREDDDAQRRKDLEEMMKGWLPTGAKVELGKIDDWSSTSSQFEVRAKVEIPSFGVPTGKRMMIPASVFPGSDKHGFDHARRVNPVYFRNPFREYDHIEVKVPEGMLVETLPQERTAKTEMADLILKTSKDGNTFKVDLQMALKHYYFMPDQYPLLKSFLDSVKSAGEEQVVLRAATK